MFYVLYSDFDFFKSVNWHKQAVKCAMPEKNIIK